METGTVAEGGKQKTTSRSKEDAGSEDLRARISALQSQLEGEQQRLNQLEQQGGAAGGRIQVCMLLCCCGVWGLGAMVFS